MMLIKIVRFYYKVVIPDRKQGQSVPVYVFQWRKPDVNVSPWIRARGDERCGAALRPSLQRCYTEGVCKERAASGHKKTLFSTRRDTILFSLYLFSSNHVCYHI